MNDERSARLSAVEKAIEYTFSDKRILNIALTHKSYVKGENNKGQFNERLEYLGDAVLELCVSEYLFSHFPEMDEGMMTRIRAQVVNGQALYETGLSLGVGESVLMSRGEERGGGRTKPSILANCVEAIIGAMYADGGKQSADRFILSFSEPRIHALAESSVVKDYKTMLQEYVQKRHLGDISYIIVSQSGPDHLRTFVMQVCINGVEMGEGEGYSKQAAGQQAAAAALIALAESTSDCD